MSKFNIKSYHSDFEQVWNDFISKSNTATFLFDRNFMDYHSDRFADASLLVYKSNGLVAICPANTTDGKVYAHQGLTYGGFIFTNDLSSTEKGEISNAVVDYFKAEGIANLFIKGIPSFYNTQHTEDEKKLLLTHGAKIYRQDKVLAIDYSKPFTIHKTKLKNYRKNSSKGFVIEQTDDFLPFWNDVLIPRLKDKHNASPVHSLNEIELLASRFPNNIKQFNIYLDNEILAGITIFDKGMVVKSQYGATTKRGEKERALEYLFLHLIYKYKDEGKSFFSMGTVREDNALGYNEGLLKQKEELGCVVYSQDFHRLDL
ncbi:FemAB family protein [uncultured Winogradskyella sp.]|uniref:FemAB family protein n=1 Tax=uncultured Winogradskyella sp. TaxID=395353 RepID=UPI00261F04EF|nr:FemAB family protein [uncultured Winogradskyella sp.]